MPNSHQHSKITIEDLLHLKKSERPSAGFLGQTFERELRKNNFPPWLKNAHGGMICHNFLSGGFTCQLVRRLCSLSRWSQ